MSFKIATWNVNSLRVRLPHVLQWLASEKPDVLALQEIKLIDDDFPYEDIRAAGYEAEVSGQKTYNGVAILSRKPCLDKITDMPGLNDPQRRVLGATYQGVRILNLYIPNGESVDSEKYIYKLNWLQQLDSLIQHELQQHSKLIVLGDFNIAPENDDVYDPKAWENSVLFSDKERAAFHRLLSHGLVDCFRLHPQPEKSFSWWDYRLNAFKRKMGLRIDHILASAELGAVCTQCTIDPAPRSLERPSDHAPVMAVFAIDV